jgi:3-oxoacyl-[acyl-carrier-protein] synthase III
MSDPFEIRGPWCIAGIGEPPSGVMPDSDQGQMNLLAANRAVQDSGIDKSEIDIVITTGTIVYNGPRHHVQLCEQRGIRRSDG